MNYDEKMKLVTNYLNAHPDYLGDNTEKALHRMEIVDDPEQPDKIIFEVERHHAWLGERYLKGEGMEAFITYWQRFEFMPSSGEMEYLGLIRPSVFNNEGDAGRQYVEDFSFEVTKLEEEKYSISELNNDEEIIVKNLIEAEKFAEKIAGEMNHSLEADRVEEALANGQKSECKTKSRHAAEMELKKMIREAWDDCIETQ